MIEGLSRLKERITRKNMIDDYRRLQEENGKQKERIEETERLIEDKNRSLKRFDDMRNDYYKVKNKFHALQRRSAGYEKLYEKLNRKIDEAKREVEMKDGVIEKKDDKIRVLKNTVFSHKSKMKEIENSHKSKMKEIENSHKSKMKEMKKRLSVMKREVKKERQGAGRLRSNLQRLSKHVFKNGNRWRYKGFSKEAGEMMHCFESPAPDVKKEPSAFEPGSVPTRGYKIPGKLNLSAFKKAVVEEGGVYACIDDKENNLSFRMPYQLYNFIYEYLGNVVKEKYGGKDLLSLGKPICLSLLEVGEKKEPERESIIKKIEKFGKLNAGRELSIKEIADKCGISTKEAGMPLSRLCKKGVCRRAERGCYVFEEAADIKDKP